MSGGLMAAFGAYLAGAVGYPELARLMPLVIGIPGLVLAGAQCALDLRAARLRPAALRARSGLAAAAARARQELGILGWAAALVGLTLGVGFSVSIPQFMALFLRLRGKESWPVTLAVAGSGWAFVHFMFAVGMKLFLFKGFFSQLLT